MVGARMADAHTYSEFWAENPDSKDPRHNTKHGMYEPHCGLDNVLMSYGHDGTFCLCGWVPERARVCVWPCGDVVNGGEASICGGMQARACLSPCR